MNSKQLREATLLLRPFIGNISPQVTQQIQDNVDKNFYDILLDAVSDDEVFKQTAIKVNPQNKSHFLFRYIVAHFCSYLKLQLEKYMSKRAIAFSSPVFMGTDMVEVFNDYLSVFQQNGQTFVDVGTSLYVIMFWTKFQTQKLKQNYEDSAGLRDEQT